MADTLGATIDDERAAAIRQLLGTPLVDLVSDPDGARLIFRHGGWLVDWFETTFGFRLVVDPAAGFARLFKRSMNPDITRPLRRSRRDKRPFDRRRYQLLCLTCASLVRHSVTTIGLLANGLASDAALDTSLRRERAAIVDVLRTLTAWGVVTFRGGDLDAFVDSEENNAILTADAHRLHNLLSSVVPACQIAPDADIDAATEELLAEPRYGAAAEAVIEAQRLRWSRHMAARAVFDDPVVYFDELHPAVADYLATSMGRRWIRERIDDAGLTLEERAEGLLAVDPTATATDMIFPSSLGNVGQLALLLIDELSPAARRRRPARSEPDDAPPTAAAMTTADLLRFAKRQLKLHPGWARSHRDGDGPARLGAEAAELLADFRLVRFDPDGRIVARPALARYRVVPPGGDKDGRNEADEVLPPPMAAEQMFLL